MKREVVVLLTRAPYGRVHVPEGLRAARGVAAGFDRHDVSVVFTQDGVYAARADVDRDALNMTDHLDDFAEEGGDLFVDEASMTERDVAPSVIAPDVAVRPGEEIVSMIDQADHTLDF
ncbi:DsrE family protein [Natrinema salifodinae]|uniref:tRNA 2-thiouridine synthesizing protein C n=1 Tax=Natrinema salifodinae TaxID=1202768 RepID=A0A1I0QR58_9EURY|nr:DsrE family protein [Natrinema salifodinae]SEW30037.1 tRNA 2-thiouridine synthesizing protein C [Natrinema salifodinae]